MEIKGKVLIIDDEEVIRNLFKRLVSKGGYEFHGAEDGPAGLKAIEEVQPDLVFCDLKMPNMDGMEVVRKVKETNKDLPIIILTGHGGMDNAVEAVKLGAYDFIRKPVDDINALLIEIDRAVESYNLVKKNKNLTEELQVINSQLEEKVEKRTADLNKTLEDLKLAQGKINEEIKTVSVLQKGLLPEAPPSIEGLDAAAIYLASSEVGGDYYDYINLGNDRLAIVVADVSGHGLAAGFVMTMVKVMLLYINKQQSSSVETLKALNEVLSNHIPTNNFVTMIYGVLDLQAKTFSFINAGHDPLVKVNSVDKSFEVFEAKSTFLGIDDSTEFQEDTITLSKNDKLVLYTDGIVEAINSKEEAFGESRLNTIIKDKADCSSQELVNEIIISLSSHCEGTLFADDISLMVLGF